MTGRLVKGVGTTVGACERRGVGSGAAEGERDRRRGTHRFAHGALELRVLHAGHLEPLVGHPAGAPLEGGQDGRDEELVHVVLARTVEVLGRGSGRPQCRDDGRGVDRATDVAGPQAEEDVAQGDEELVRQRLGLGVRLLEAPSGCRRWRWSASGRGEERRAQRRGRTDEARAERVRDGLDRRQEVADAARRRRGFRSGIGPNSSETGTH